MDRRDIRRLPPEVARKIAAGEVIERPASVLRELLENSIDSGASAVSVTLESGGLMSITVADDGCGMSSDDLSLVSEPHATSKIRSEEDLLAIGTLGFRGEALSSIAAVAELRICTAVDSANANEFLSRPGRGIVIDRQARKRGTTVTVRSLFESFPARKRFLKRPASETAVALQTFIDRALPHPHIDFRLLLDGKPKLILPASSLKARVLAAYQPDEPESFFREISGEAGHFAYSAVLGGPELRRPDRRHLQCFVNGRRVQDFSLQKAIEVGFIGVLPGGFYPFAFMFLSIDPGDIDFNIHPAKKEIRFRDPGSIQSELIGLVRAALSGCRTLVEEEAHSHQSTPGQDFAFGQPTGERGVSAGDDAERLMLRSAWYPKTAKSGFPSLDDLRAVAESRRDYGALQPPAPGESRIIGQCLDLFIAFQTGDALYLLDQHAAHERIIFDRLSLDPPRIQEMLVPFEIHTQSEEQDGFLASRLGEFASSGYLIEAAGPGVWNLTGHPEGLRAEAGDMAAELLKSAVSEGGNLLRSLRALTACHSAVREGETLEHTAMEELVKAALALPDPHCPHGRPVWIRLPRAELYRRILRSV